MLIHKELTDYLKEKDFETFMQAWKIQFEKHGTMAGNATIILTPQNRENIENFIGIDTKSKPQIQLSWAKFKKQLSKTKFENVDFIKVLELYFGEELLTKTETVERRRNEVIMFLETLLNEEMNHQAKSWIEESIRKRNSTFLHVIQNKESEEILYDNFVTVFKALNYLPFNKPKSIAVFSSKLTQDPHALDQDTPLYYLLTQALLYIKSTQNQNSAIETDILNQFGLFKEDINNYCTIYGFSATTNGKVHQGWEGFYQQKEFWNVNLNNVRNIDDLEPKDSKAIFILENPSIFEALVKTTQSESLQLSFICSNGQPTQILYNILDKINNKNIPIYYAGDFDPEGLLMAQRLLDYSPCLKLWHYTIEDYQAQRSKKKATSPRIKMLAQLKDPQLIQIGNYVNDYGIGYQENMLETYKSSLLKFKMVDP